MKKIKYFTIALNIISPVFAFSQTLDINAAGTRFYDVLDYINEIINFLNPIVFSLSFVVFFWGLSKYILNSDNKDAIEKGKNYMLWGILVLFILISFRAIISFIARDLGIGDGINTPFIPQG
jgi:hypothetical protein